MIDSFLYLGLVFALFSIGIFLTTRRNMIRILLGVEIVLNAGNLAFIYFASPLAFRTGYIDPLGQSIVFMSIILGGSVIAVALSLVVNAYKQYRTMDVRKLRRLKW
jgi:multisubunit Na+/H+ antiporter MnhC subunit